jgi:hypothetical protein
LKVKSVDEKLRRHKSYWLRRITRMNNNKMPKIMLNYKSNTRRRIDRLVKKLLDDAETGQRGPNSRRIMLITMIMLVIIPLCTAWLKCELLFLYTGDSSFTIKTENLFSEYINTGA